MTWLVSYAIGFVLYFVLMYALYSQAKYDVDVWSWNGKSARSRERKMSSSSLDEAMRKRTVMSRFLLLSPVWPLGALVVLGQIVWWLVRLSCRSLKTIWKEAWS